MSVAFNRMPTNLRVPLFYAEVNSGLSFFQGNSRHLVIGQKLAAGSAAADTPILVQNARIDALFGRGAMIGDMIRAARRNNPFGEIWALPLADPAGAPATQLVTISGALTPGLLVLYVAGQKFAIAISAADTPTTAAASLAAAINAGYVDLDGTVRLTPFIASAALGVVTLTARQSGALSGWGGVDKDLVGDEGANAATIAIAPGAAGAGVPAMTAGLAALGAQEFDFISFPYADTTTLDAFKSFLSDSGGRWDPTVDLYGWAFTVNFGGLAAQATLGLGRNDPHVHIMAVQASPTPPWIWAAAIGAQVQAHKNLGADLTQAGEISRPVQTLILQDVRPPKAIAQRWTPPDRQTLYFDGVSAFHVTRDGLVALDRLISTYQTDAWGSPDATWLDIETSCQTAYALRYLKQVVTQTYPRSALVPDNPQGLQGFATPADIKGTLIAAYAKLCRAGIMKNAQLFADNLIVEQASDPNRVNVYLPLDVVNQLRIVAVNATARLNAAA